MLAFLAAKQDVNESLPLLAGVSAHVNSDPGRFRHAFVDHEGQKKLGLLDNSLRLGDWKVQWDRPVAALCSQVLKHLSNDNAGRVMKASFTTTDAAARAAHNMGFMDTVKAYLTHNMYTECGIPHTDILGSKKEREDMTAVIGPLLAELELGGWNDQLQKILQKFAHACNGHSKEDRAFWRGMLKYNGGGGSGGRASVTGWLTMLFPYISSGINPAVHIARKEDPRPAQQSTKTDPGGIVHLCSTFPSTTFPRAPPLRPSDGLTMTQKETCF